MDSLTPTSLLGASAALYTAGGAAALAFIGRQRFGNILSHILCMIAAAAGAASSGALLFFGRGTVSVSLPLPTAPLIELAIRADRLSAWFLLILSILAFCVSLYSIGYNSHYYGKRNVGAFNLLYALFILSMMLVITAGSAILFLIAWEAMAVVSYLLVVFESEDPEIQKAGLLYAVMTHIGTAFLIIAFMVMYSYTGTFDMSGASGAIPEAARNVLFLLFLVGFGTKAGVIPLHIWLPHAHPAAPGNISALMSGIMIKTAVYGLLRFVSDYLGVQEAWWGVVLLIIGLLSIFFGVAYAFIEQNIKRLLAYSSIENMGIIFAATGLSFIGFAGGSDVVGSLAMAAALLHCFNHALFKGCLFLGAGSVHFATHSKNMEELGGLIRRMPKTAVIFLAAALSISAIVPFNGFISEWLLYQSFFAAITPGEAAYSIFFILSVAVLALAGGLAAACFIKLFGISFLGLARSGHAAEAAEVPGTMSAGSGILAALCLFAGVFPLYFIGLANRALAGFTGASMPGLMTGGILPVYEPLAAGGSSILPQWIPVLMGAFALIALAVAAFFGKGRAPRRCGTWDCGFEALTPRMQYSGTAFSKPIHVIFRMIYKSTRDLRIQGEYIYHPESVEYVLSTDSVFEKHVYDPLLKWVAQFAQQIKFRVQTGSVHTYLLYIFLAVLALMFYNRIA